MVIIDGWGNIFLVCFLGDEIFEGEKFDIKVELLEIVVKICGLGM